MSHIPPRLQKRAGGISPLPAWPPLLDSRGRTVAPAPLPRSRRMLRDAALLARTLFFGAVFALSVWGIIWAFAVIEAVAR